MAALAHFENAVKRFGRTTAVDGLTLDIPEGVVTAFLGPNGAGKTTSIKCLLNLIPLTSGSISVLGQDSSRLGPGEFREIGYVSENQELPLWMTVSQFLDYCRPMYPAWDVELEHRLLKQFELPGGTRLRALSRGMRVKAALLSALAYRPRLIVLDEPFSGLDALVRDEFLRGLLELTECEGWSVFVSSHDIEEVERLADHVAILNAGHLALNESVDRLQQRFRSVEVVLDRPFSLPDSLPPTWLNAEASGRRARFVDSAYTEEASIRNTEDVFGRVKDRIAAGMSLRDIFVALARTYRLKRAVEGGNAEAGVPGPVSAAKQAQVDTDGTPHVDSGGQR